MRTFVRIKISLSEILPRRTQRYLNSDSCKGEEMAAIKNISYEQSQHYISGERDTEREALGEKEVQHITEGERVLMRLLDDSLTVKQKCYLMLYYKDGLTVREIADRFSVAPSTVSRTITRGRKRIAGEAARQTLKRIISRKEDDNGSSHK